jgi:hypothetical protein
MTTLSKDCQSRDGSSVQPVVAFETDPGAEAASDTSTLPADPASPLLTELHVSDMEQTYRRFAEVVGEDRWRNRVQQLEAAIKGQPAIAETVRAENEIAYSLEMCRLALESRRVDLGEPVFDRELYPAISFAAQVLSVVDGSTPTEADKLRRRVIGGLKKPADMRGYRLELYAATHLRRRGHKIVWPEMVGGGTFDLLIPDIGKSGLEVECKSISEDKGRKIHRLDADIFRGLILDELEPVLRELTVGLAITLTVPVALPRSPAALKGLAQSVRRQIYLSQSGQLPGGIHLQIEQFDLALAQGLTQDQNSPRLRQLIQTVTRTRNRYGFLAGGIDGAPGRIAFVVQSAIEDNFLDEVFSTLSHSSKQLTRKKPGFLLTGLALTGQQMLATANQDNDPSQLPSPLARHTSRFLSSDTRDHVVGVAFLSRSELAPESAGLVESGGIAYAFPKPTVPFWEEGFRGLFTGS